MLLTRTNNFEHKLFCNEKVIKQNKTYCIWYFESNEYSILTSNKHTHKLKSCK